MINPGSGVIFQNKVFHRNSNRWQIFKIPPTMRIRKSCGKSRKFCVKIKFPVECTAVTDRLLHACPKNFQHVRRSFSVEPTTRVFSGCQISCQLLAFQSISVLNSGRPKTSFNRTFLIFEPSFMFVFIEFSADCLLYIDLPNHKVERPESPVVH